MKNVVFSYKILNLNKKNLLIIVLKNIQIIDY